MSTDATRLHIDVEDLAFRTRGKPGLRLTLEPESVPAARARYERIGAHVTMAAHRVALSRTELDVLYVAWTRDDALALRDAEAPSLRPSLMGPSEATLRSGHRALGRLLGFPACCVDHFLDSSGRWSRSGLGRVATSIRWGRARLGLDVGPASPLPAGDPRRLDGKAFARIARDAHDYVAAREILEPSPDARLNHLLFTARLRLISFYPCSYRCPAAIDVADGALRALDTVAEGAGRRYLRDLAVPVVVGACGGRAVVTLGADRTIVAALPPSASDRPARAVDQALATRCVGHRADDHGFVPGVARRSEEPALLLAFGERAVPTSAS